MLRRPLRYAYDKLGPRYVRWAIWVQFQFAHLVVLGGVGLLTLYVNIDRPAFWRILVVSQVLVVVENLVSLKIANKLVRPADPWLDGERNPQTALAAWRALAGLPIDYIRHRRSLVVISNVVPISVFITIELDTAFLPAFLIICVAASIVLLYGVLLRFFALELVVSPILEETSCELTDDTELSGVTVPLRTRLLVALPAINVITGVVVAGFASPHDSLDSLGIGVILAIAVAFTISLELSLLLTRSIVEPLQDLRVGTQRVRAGDLGVRVSVLGTDETGLLAASFNSMVDGLRERERLREAFGAFVDPVLADRVIAEGTTLAGEEVDVTVFFLDIRGFTAFAERAGAAEAVARLNQFYEIIVPIVVAHGGHANKFVGDGLLAVFGAPDALPDHADRCVAAALEVANEVEATQGGRVSIGIGINSGDVVAGTVGGGGRVEFTVIGDVVNTAARVEEATRQTGDVILVTAATRALLREDHGGLVRRPSIPLKGKREPVELFALSRAPAVTVPLRVATGV
jgi:class 3 adenylate cyclase